MVGAFPPNSIDKFEDVFSFVYENGKDLSGFIDGMAQCTCWFKILDDFCQELRTLLMKMIEKLLLLIIMVEAMSSHSVGFIILI